MILRGIALPALIFYKLITSGGASKLNVIKERISINTAQQGNFKENFLVNGIVSIYLNALEGGRVEEKYVEDGTILETGDPILRLSNIDLELKQASVFNLLSQMQISHNARTDKIRSTGLTHSAITGMR